MVAETDNADFLELISNKFDIKGSEEEIKKLTELLQQIYQTTEGKDLLESLSGNPKIALSHGMLEGANGEHANHSIKMANWSSTTLFHELLHERQEQENVRSGNALSPEDAYLTNIMQEMEVRINSECFVLKDYLQNDPEKLKAYQDDNESDIGFLYQNFLKLKEKNPNLSDDELLNLAKSALSERYLEQIKETQKEIDEIKKEHPEYSAKDIEKQIMENESMSKSEKGHKQTIIGWFVDYQDQFEGAKKGISINQTKDGKEIFDYYKERLNLNTEYEDVFKNMFDKNAQIQQVDETTKNILIDGKIVGRICETEQGREICVYEENSTEIKSKRIETANSIQIFDKDNNLISEKKI